MAGISPQRLRRVLFFINPSKDHAREAAAKIRSDLERRNIETGTYSLDKMGDLKSTGGFDIAFSLGGDGTVLYAARKAAPAGIPVMPINLGTMGFIAGVGLEDWDRVLDQWIAGTVRVSKRLMLELQVVRKEKTVLESICLNDTVVSASGIAKLIRLRVRDDENPIAEYRSDGLIVATPTGSTAYSMAAGGPILDPEMEAIIINPICPFTLSNRPFVLPSRERVIIEVEQGQRSGVRLTVDGQETENLECGDRICIKQAPYALMLIGSGRNDFYRALREKLSWSGAGGGGVHA
jgi:NAD+ kinase